MGSSSFSPTIGSTVTNSGSTHRTAPAPERACRKLIVRLWPRHRRPCPRRPWRVQPANASVANSGSSDTPNLSVTPMGTDQALPSIAMGLVASQGSEDASWTDAMASARWLPDEAFAALVQGYVTRSPAWPSAFSPTSRLPLSMSGRIRMNREEWLRYTAWPPRSLSAASSSGAPARSTEIIGRHPHSRLT
jgi:hypothetical protein